MSGVVSNYFGRMVPNGHLAECIEFLEDGLRCLKPTLYHQVLGKDFLAHTDDLGTWIADFWKKCADADVRLAALYLEMNGFTINPGHWHCDVFGHKTSGDVWDLEWLEEWDAEHRECFVLTGMEDVQDAYAKLFTEDEQPLGVQLAEEITEHLVTARFMQLVAAAHEAAKAIDPAMARVKVFATAHDWDNVHMTE